MKCPLARLSALVLPVVIAVAQEPGPVPAPPRPVRPAASAPRCTDHTGIAWSLPFDAARARATAERRLLLIKPIAFGTTADGGW